MSKPLHKLPLLGSNQEPPDPESAAPPSTLGALPHGDAVEPQRTGIAHTKTHTISHTPWGQGSCAPALSWRLAVLVAR
jgi:hypothetical protein